MAVGSLNPDWVNRHCRLFQVLWKMPFGEWDNADCMIKYLLPVLILTSGCTGSTGQADSQPTSGEEFYRLRLFHHSTQDQLAATEGLYQNKLDMFNAGGEIILFDKLDFQAVFYGDVLSGGHMPNLMYMTCHADSATREANWKAFVESDEWQEMSSDPIYQNNVSHADIFLLRPTVYSEY